MTTQDTSVKLESSWLDLLGDQFQQPYFSTLKQKLHAEKSAGFTVFPPGSRIFAALDLCPVDKVRVVILGQDPYHNVGQAHGLCFSVPQGIDIPPSLVNIYKELHADLGIVPAKHGNLESWARQGVLLLNTSLTVRAHQAASHFGWGWEIFTDTVIKRISEKQRNLVFLLWGSPARKKKDLVSPQNGHLVLEAPHPSPLSAHRGFLGCKHFSQCNAFLQQNGFAPIDWKV